MGKTIRTIIVLLAAVMLLAGCDPKMGNQGGFGTQNSGTGSIPRSGESMEVWKAQGGTTLGKITFPPDSDEPCVKPTGKPKQLIQDISDAINQWLGFGNDSILGDQELFEWRVFPEDVTPEGDPVDGDAGHYVCSKEGKTFTLENGMEFDQYAAMIGGSDDQLRYQYFGSFTKNSVRHSFDFIFEWTGTETVKIVHLDNGWYDVKEMFDSTGGGQEQ